MRTNIIRKVTAVLAGGALSAALALTLPTPGAGASDGATEADVRVGLTAETSYHRSGEDGVVMSQADFPCEEDEVLAYGPGVFDGVTCQHIDTFVPQTVTERFGG